MKQQQKHKAYTICAKKCISAQQKHTVCNTNSIAAITTKTHKMVAFLAIIIFMPRLMCIFDSWQLQWSIAVGIIVVRTTSIAIARSNNRSNSRSISSNNKKIIKADTAYATNNNRLPHTTPICHIRVCCNIIWLYYSLTSGRPTVHFFTHSFSRSFSHSGHK